MQHNTAQFLENGSTAEQPPYAAWTQRVNGSDSHVQAPLIHVYNAWPETDVAFSQNVWLRAYSRKV